MQLTNNKGVIISQVVPGSPADKAGLKIKDILISINKKPMTSAAQVRNTLGMMRPGTKIKLEVIRQHKKQTLTAKVGDPKQELKQRINPFLAGVSFRDFSEIETDGSQLTGVIVTNITETSQAALAGVVPGDVITQANGQTIASTQDLINIASKHIDSLLLSINRDNLNAFLVIEKP